MKKWLTYLESKSEHHIIPTKARVSREGDWENVATVQLVVTRSAVQIAVATVVAQDVVSATPIHPVVAAAVDQTVGSTAAFQQVVGTGLVGFAGIQVIVPGAAEQPLDSFLQQDQWLPQLLQREVEFGELDPPHREPAGAPVDSARLTSARPRSLVGMAYLFDLYFRLDPQDDRVVPVDDDV
jgi:hypothetical protein